MISQGASTLDVRTEYENTTTLPNHTGMFTGLRVDRLKHGHGITYDTDGASTVHKAAHHYVSSVFDVVHDRGGSTALFAAKQKFALYARSWNTEGRWDRSGTDHGRHKIDQVGIVGAWPSPGAAPPGRR